MAPSFGVWAWKCCAKTSALDVGQRDDDGVFVWVCFQSEYRHAKTINYTVPLPCVSRESTWVNCPVAATAHAPHATPRVSLIISVESVHSPLSSLLKNAQFRKGIGKSQKKTMNYKRKKKQKPYSFMLKDVKIERKKPQRSQKKPKCITSPEILTTYALAAVPSREGSVVAPASAGVSRATFAVCCSQCGA